MTSSIDREFFSAFSMPRETIDKAIGLEGCLWHVLKKMWEKEPYDERTPFTEMKKASLEFREVLEEIETAKTGKLTHELALKYLKAQKLPFEMAIDLGWFDLLPHVGFKTAMGESAYSEVLLSEQDVLMHLFWFVRVKYSDEDAGEFGYQGFKTLCHMNPPFKMIASDLCPSARLAEMPISPKFSKEPWIADSKLYQIARINLFGGDSEICYISRRAPSYPWQFSSSAQIGEGLLVFFLEKTWCSITPEGTLDPLKVSLSPKTKGYYQSMVYLMSELSISFERLDALWAEPYILNESEAMYSPLSPASKEAIHRKTFAIYRRALKEAAIDRRFLALAAWVTRQKSALFKC